LVLAGGGSRGAYQIGVWRALRELGISFAVVTGSSVGALNGAMMAQGDYETAESLWLSLYTADVVDYPDFPREVDYSKNGWEGDVWKPFIRRAVASEGADFAPLEKLIRKQVEESRVRHSDIRFGLVTVEYPSMKAVELGIDEIPEGKLCDYMVASAACFPAFRSKEIDGTQYIDGGYHDNMPINLAVRLGAEEILAVNLNGLGIERKPKDTSIPITALGSYWDLGPFLWFEPGLSSRNMQLGYLDTMKLYGEYEGWAYTYFPGVRKELAKFWNRKLDHFEQSHGMIRNGKSLAQKAAWSRILRTLKKKRRIQHEVEALWLAAAEIAGEYLGADPLSVYGAATYCAEIENAWEKMDRAVEHPDGWQAILSLRKLIQNWSPEEDGGMWGAALLSPEAFVTAAILELIAE
jgi:NTE family protein